MNVQQSIAYIESYTWSTTRLGLSRTRELLRLLGDPQKRLHFIHVAGTNGKGSTCAMLESILRHAGYKTGLYTSPHICRFNERMQVNGQDIPDEALAEITSYVAPIADAMADHPSQFELVTAIAMAYFLREACDIVVLEVGMGGALDSTNVIDAPEVSVITNIGLEHTEYLGNTLPEIASAKAGIIKPGCPAVCYHGEPEVEKVFAETCREKGCDLHFADFAGICPTDEKLSGQVFSLGNLGNVHLPLLGEHQRKNAAVVLKTIDVLRKRGFVITGKNIREGLMATRWPVRFEVLREDPPVIVDGAHNPQCAMALAQTMEKYLPGKQTTFVMGVLADKDYGAILSLLRPYDRRFICVTPQSPRALKAVELAAYLKKLGEDAQSTDSISEAVEKALLFGEPLLACGSLYIAGVAREELLKLL